MMGVQAEAGGVLLISVDEPAGRSLLSALEAATLQVEWARSLAELHTRAARPDAHTPALVFLDLELPDAAAAEQLVPLVRTYFPNATMIALAAELSGEAAARLLSQGVPSLTKPVSPFALTGLALRLSLGVGAAWHRAPGGRAPNAAPNERPPGERMESLVDAYAADRLLSKQQRMILRFYLDGRNDKAIAGLCGCSEATVYEHWRRMAKKVGGAHKGDAIADFHRYLASV
ncbi:MAG TPA: LuxR C-terminal-related transcriptional regulator [Kofleriaceae bacterium]|jgi:DNA-binding NarL/FixJ family response regulator|nr:LuxR C-terminal-related transcriptional regulator [Kofleriaceae bacterium]